MTLRRVVAALVLAGAVTSTLCAQTQNRADDPNRRRGGTQDDQSGRRGGGSPEEMQARMMASLRDRFEVADDEEWKLISDRLSKVMELRRNSTGGGGGFAFGGRGGPPGGGSDRGSSSRSRGTSGNTEMAALTAALRDKMPDAEIKSRLDRVREVRKDNDAKLVKAQEELRALLSVRQEAIAVMFGMLP